MLFITNQVSSSNNFSSGYVFATTNIIQNAFIDVSDNVYSTTVYPLFQSQSTFTNLKIQFGAQTLNSGSFILSSVQSIIINQMNIISRPGSQITVNANSQLNILTNSPTGAVINNMLVNIFIASSSGNITLINNINGVFNVSGYQVIGNYNSTSTVAMIGLNVKTATINVNQVRLQPSSFNVGNGSSYLFGSSVLSVSTIMINNFAVIIGSSSNFLLLGSISTTDADANYYMFGGVVAYISSASSVSVNNVLLDSYQKFSTSYVSWSGFLIGNIYSSSSNTTIQNVCLLQKIWSTTLKYSNFGLIGWNYGNTSIQNAWITFHVHGDLFYSFGVIGYQYSSSIYAEVKNLRTFVNVSSSKGYYIGLIFGYESAKNCSVQNTSLVGGNINSGSTYYVGGIFGYQSNNMTVLSSSIFELNIQGDCYYASGIIGYEDMNANATILDSSISSTNIFGSYQVGGLIGQCKATLHLTNILITFVRLSGSSTSFGIVVGQNEGGTYSFTNSTARSNFIKDVQQTECTVLKTNSWSITGC
ncbi:Hypothetical_protein [Hexamita inflata]|uniref:Hypothetical_protein n=1 Tax=Hexamita inflata TaxID=28002 RepID=A0AA86UY86_9EUKA|nr:Hypothetical protein HINF_LOCUS40263 [Hexamita inflata]